MANDNDRFTTALESGKILISDGATGTNLQTKGLPTGVPAETWVLEQPEQILTLHRSFVDAGSDIILTCTFGGNRLCDGLNDADRARDVNLQAAHLARTVADAAEHDIFVAGSMGPTGKMMEPLGTLSHAEVVSAYGEQASALSDGGVDLLLLETFYALEEAKAAIEGVRQASSLPLICSFSYDREMRTMMGVSPTQMAAAIGPLGVTALGANCGTTPENMEKIVAELATLNMGLPLWVKPNAGLPVGSPPRYDLKPAEMAEFAIRFVAQGAQVVGGCCGNSPEHLYAIAQAIRS